MPRGRNPHHGGSNTQSPFPRVSVSALAGQQHLLGEETKAAPKTRAAAFPWAGREDAEYLEQGAERPGTDTDVTEFIENFIPLSNVSLEAWAVQGREE